MRKFKVGDIIKGKKGNRYEFASERMKKAKVVEENVYGNGMKVDILEHDDKELVQQILIVKNDPELFDFAEKECIVIYRDGDKTVALDKRTKRKAVTKCSPDDEFNFYEGAEIAFDMLKAKECKAVENGKLKVGDYVKVVNTGTIYSQPLDITLRQLGFAEYGWKTKYGYEPYRDKKFTLRSKFVVKKEADYYGVRVFLLDNVTKNDGMIMIEARGVVKWE